jgi:hypothetical protein
MGELLSSNLACGESNSLSGWRGKWRRFTINSLEWTFVSCQTEGTAAMNQAGGKVDLIRTLSGWN